MVIVIDTNHLRKNKPVCFFPESNLHEIKNDPSPCVKVNDPPQRLMYSEKILRKDLQFSCEVVLRGDKKQECIRKSEHPSVMTAYDGVKEMVGNFSKLKENYDDAIKGTNADSTFIRLAEVKGVPFVTEDDDAFKICKEIAKGNKKLKCFKSPPKGSLFYS